MAYEYARAYQIALRDYVLAAKARPCMDCGVSYPSHVLQFDHVRGKKLFNLSSSWMTKSLRLIREEIEKCEIVCANCHSERTFRRSAKKAVSGEKVSGKKVSGKKALQKGRSQEGPYLGVPI